MHCHYLILCLEFQYGNVHTGWIHYKKQNIAYVKCSNQVYFTAELVESYASLLHHGWLSQEGQSEAYNESHRNSKKVDFFKSFLMQNPNVGNHFKKRNVQNKDVIDDEISIPENDQYNEGQLSNSMFEMHRKNLSQALYRHWIFEELRDRNKVGKFLFGPRYDESGRLITYQESVDKFLCQVDNWRTGEIYKHGECTGLSFVYFVESDKNEKLTTIC